MAKAKRMPRIVVLVLIAMTFRKVNRSSRVNDTLNKTMRSQPVMESSSGSPKVSSFEVSLIVFRPRQHCQQPVSRENSHREHSRVSSRDTTRNHLDFYSNFYLFHGGNVLGVENK